MAGWTSGLAPLHCASGVWVWVGVFWGGWVAEFVGGFRGRVCAWVGVTALRIEWVGGWAGWFVGA